MMHEPIKSRLNISFVKNKNKQSFTGKSCAWCGKALDMYYTPWCPICDKPKLKRNKLNLIQVKRHLIQKHNISFDKTWTALCDNFEFRNDTDFRYEFGMDGLEKFDEYLRKDFNCKKEFTFHVSW